MQHFPKCTPISSSSAQVKKWQFVPIPEGKSGLVDRVREGMGVPRMDPRVALSQFSSLSEYTED